MADTAIVVFTQPVRVHKKRYAKDETAAIEAEIAAELVALGAAKEADTPKAKTEKKA